MTGRWLQRAILRAASLLMPDVRRAEWLKEWLSELWYVPRRGATHFCLGAFRDALWLRRNEPEAQRPSQSVRTRLHLQSPFRCLAFLAALASLSLWMAVCLPASQRLTRSTNFRTRDLLNGCVGMLLLSSLIVPAILALGACADRYPIPWPGRLRRGIFLAGKIALLHPVMLCGFVVMLTFDALPLAPLGFIVACVGAFYWIFADQRRRCPVCLRLFASPVRIGTLLRSSRHRVVLACYLGGGLALVALFLGAAMEAVHRMGTGILHRVNPPMLASTVVMLCASWLGTRTLFSLPLDLRANWLFRVTPALERGPSLALSVFPVVAASAVLLLWFWPWRPAVEHLLLLGLLGSILADLSLKGFRNIPFTCSYLPGKWKVHMIFWFGFIPLVIAINEAVEWEQQALARPRSYWLVAAALGVVAFAARKFTDASVSRSGLEIQFEESASDELVRLGLNR